MLQHWSVKDKRGGSHARKTATEKDWAGRTRKTIVKKGLYAREGGVKGRWSGHWGKGGSRREGGWTRL